MTRRRLLALSIALPALSLGLGVLVSKVVVPWVRLENRFRQAGDPSTSFDRCLRLLGEMREIRPDLEGYLIGKARSRSLDDVRRVGQILERRPGLDRAELWDARLSSATDPKTTAEPWVDSILTLYLELLIAEPRDTGPALDEVHAEALQRIAFWTSFPHAELYWTDLLLDLRYSGHSLAGGGDPLNPQELARKLPFRRTELAKVRREFADWVRAGAGRGIYGAYGMMGDDGRPVRLRPNWYPGDQRIGFCRLEEQAPRAKWVFGNRK